MVETQGSISLTGKGSLINKGLAELEGLNNRAEEIGGHQRNINSAMIQAAMMGIELEFINKLTNLQISGVSFDIFDITRSCQASIEERRVSNDYYNQKKAQQGPMKGRLTRDNAALIKLSPKFAESIHAATDTSKSMIDADVEKARMQKDEAELEAFRSITLHSQACLLDWAINNGEIMGVERVDSVTRMMSTSVRKVGATSYGTISPSGTANMFLSSGVEEQGKVDRKAYSSKTFQDVMIEYFKDSEHVDKVITFEDLLVYVSARKMDMDDGKTHRVPCINENVLLATDFNYQVVDNLRHQSLGLYLGWMYERHSSDTVSTRVYCVKRLGNEAPQDTVEQTGNDSTIVVTWVKTPLLT